MEVKQLEKNAVTSLAPSSKQAEAGFVILKTINDFQFVTPNGISFTETAKHLFIAKQEKFEVRLPFDYPANYPTSPSTDLMLILNNFVNKKILKKKSTSKGNFFKITEKGRELLNAIEASLRSLASGPDTVQALEQLHKREIKHIFNTRNRDKTSTEELQSKEVRPLMLNLLKELRIVYVDPSLRRLNRAELLVPYFEELEEAEIISASESVIEYAEGRKKQTSLYEESHEISKRGEILDFAQKLMYGTEKYNNNGFLAKTGELALLYAPIEYYGKNKDEQIYRAGACFNRKILVKSDVPLKINVGHHREVFILALIRKGISRAIAIGIPSRFFDEFDFRSDDYREETLDRILSVIRPHLNLGESNSAIKKFYDEVGIMSEEKPEEATTKIMLWLQKKFGILDIPQLGVDDPYPEFERTIEGLIPKGYVNNCKEFAALVAILVTCMPVNNHPRLFVQFCTVKSGRSHVRMCIKRENGLLLPLDLEYIPEVDVMLTRQIGGKKSD